MRELTSMQVSNNIFGTNEQGDSGIGCLRAGLLVAPGGRLYSISHNLISGNFGDGVIVESGLNGVIHNNTVGTSSKTGSRPLPNGGACINCRTVSLLTVADNVLGAGSIGLLVATGSSFVNLIGGK